MTHAFFDRQSAGVPSLSLLAPAKVNLTLDVLGRRPDGYHALASIMASVNLFDQVILQTAPPGVLEVTWEGQALPQDNTARRAAEAFFAQRPGGARVHLIKAIPQQAGLGGGSADAAAVLRGLSRLYGGIDGPALFAMARAVGADVPFCLQGGCALAEGIGHKLTPLPCPQLHLLLLMGETGVSTAALFRSLRLPLPHPDTQGALAALQGPPQALAPFLRNALEAPAIALAPEIGLLKDALLAQGALAAFMTGSGACVAGLFPTLEAGRQAYGHFTGLPFRALCSTGDFAV